MHLKLLCSLALVGLALATPRRFDGYQVLKTDKLSQHQASLLQHLMTTSLSYDFHREPVPGRKAVIQVGPEDLPVLKIILEGMKLPYTTMIEDVQSVIDLSPGSKVKPGDNPDLHYQLTWDNYYSQDVINEFIDEMAATYSFVETKEIGTTYEGRGIRAIEITNAPAGSDVVYIETAIHAREWITEPTVTYAIHQLLEGEGTRYLDRLNFFIIPLANPDGYEYTRTDDRTWRKNRVVNEGATCRGVDLNRNFPFHYDESGVSHQPCSDVFDGPGPASELETQALISYFADVQANYGTPEMALCFHSAIPAFLWPYGYDYDVYAENWQELEALAQATIDAINAAMQANGHSPLFEQYNSASLYPAAGAADDYYKSEGARYVYTPELQSDGFSFYLPENLVQATVEENWEGFKVLFDEVYNN